MRSICHTNHAVVQIILLDLTVSNITQVINHLSKGEKITHLDRETDTHTHPCLLYLFQYQYSISLKRVALGVCLSCVDTKLISGILHKSPSFQFGCSRVVHTRIPFFSPHELLECRIHGTCSGLMGRLFPPSCHGPRGPELNQAFHNSPKNKKGFVA